MTEKLHQLPSKYLYTAWTTILTIGLVLALWGLQTNSNNDFNRSQKADADQVLAFCHAVADNNQAVRDILSLLSVDTKTTPDMTPSQLESIRVANERRKGYRLITQDLFPNPKCTDGYQAKSRQDELRPMLTVNPTTTSVTRGTQ